jgi:hypothetical protein
MCVATTFSIACGEERLEGFAGAGAACGSCGGACTFSLRASETCWPDRIRGSGTLPVSSVCDTVVMGERRGRRYVGGNGVRDSRSVLRAERASKAMAGCVQWLRAYVYFSWVRRRMGNSRWLPRRARVNFWCGKFAATFSTSTSSPRRPRSDLLVCFVYLSLYQTSSHGRTAIMPQNE